MTNDEAKDEFFRINANNPTFNLEPYVAIVKWTKGKLSARPEHYAGRGINRGDLNEDILEMLWAGIMEDVGLTAADNFIFMVQELKNMSASAFLTAFLSYYRNSFVYKPRKQTIIDQFTHEGRSDDPGTRMALQIGMLELMIRTRKNAPSEEEEEAMSLNLKAPFLEKHGCKVKWLERNCSYT